MAYNKTVTTLLSQIELDRKQDVVSMVHEPTEAKIRDYFQKYRQNEWKGASVQIVMASIHKARLVLGIKTKESLKWLEDHDLDPSDIPELLGDYTRSGV